MGTLSCKRRLKINCTEAVVEKDTEGPLISALWVRGTHDPKVSSHRRGKQWGSGRCTRQERELEKQGLKLWHIAIGFPEASGCDKCAFIECRPMQ